MPAPHTAAAAAARRSGVEEVVEEVAGAIIVLQFAACQFPVAAASGYHLGDVFEAAPGFGAGGVITVQSPQSTRLRSATARQAVHGP